MNYSENLSNLSIFNVDGKMFADAFEADVEIARENETNPIEWIQDLLEEYALEGLSDYKHFKVTDKEAFAYKVKEIINYLSYAQITNEDIEEYLKK